MPENQKKRLQLSRSRGTAFAAFGIGFSAIGLANLELGFVQIPGNAPAAGALLAVSLGCLLTSLFHPFKELGQEEKEKEEEPEP